MQKLDAVAYDILGKSVLQQIYSERNYQGEGFKRVAYTHPAIFMVEYSLAQTLVESGITADYVMGTSMGEFASAALADVMKAEELLELIVKQAEYFETYCEPGSMMAVIHDSQLYHEVPLIRENSELASVNYNSHFVISGHDERLAEIACYFKKESILYQFLPVTYGYHSPCIDPAAAIFKNYLSPRSYQQPSISYISGLHGTFLKSIPPDYFWDVVRMQIQFPKAFKNLESGGDNIYIDLGPGGTLANFAKRNMTGRSNSEAYSIITPFHQELKNINKIIGIIAAKNMGTA